MGADALMPKDILGVVLAGGLSRRFGSDKAIALLRGRRLIERVVSRVRPQIGALAISGRHYGLALPVIGDAMPSEGPLTGILSSLRWARGADFAAVATFSCDTPFLPPDLVARLAEKLPFNPGCVLATAQGVRQSVFALWRVSALDALEEIYAAGTRSLNAAQDMLGAIDVAFPVGEAPNGDMFFNINRVADQNVAQAWLDGAETAGDPRSGAGRKAVTQGMAGPTGHGSHPGFEAVIEKA